MSYMRGDCYVWGDGHRTHIWVADGEDGWAESGWACDSESNRTPDRLEASGVGILDTTFDELVVMRIAEMIREGLIAGAIDRVAGPGGSGGNIGSYTLMK